MKTFKVSDDNIICFASKIELFSSKKNHDVQLYLFGLFHCCELFISLHSFQAHLREAKCHIALGSVDAASNSLAKVKELDPNNSQCIEEVFIFC